MIPSMPHTPANARQRRIVGSSSFASAVLGLSIQNDKTLVAIGAIALQTAVNAAIAQYNAAAPAAAPVGASA